MSTTPLRVMQLVLSLTIGGTEKLVCDITERVDKELISPVVCCLNEIGPWGQELRKKGYDVYELQRQPGLDWKLIQRLALLLQQENIEVIHAHQYTPYCYGLMSSWYRKCTRPFAKRPKIVFTEHGRFYPEQKKMKRMLVNPIFSLLTEKIVTISESTKSSLVEYENFPEKKIEVVYNGIDLHRFPQKADAAARKQSLGLDPDALIIGIVARLDPIKNHAMLLRAFRQVLEQLPNTYLIIVGGGPEEQHLKTYAQSLGITENTMFWGARDNVPELVQMLDVFALSSLSEGTSVTLLEAMSAGLPIVATRVGGNPEVIVDRETGYLVQSDDDREMAAKLLKLLQDKDVRQKMGKAGRERAHHMFSLDKMVETYTNMYLKVSGEHEQTLAG